LEPTFLVQLELWAVLYARSLSESGRRAESRCQTVSCAFSAKKTLLVVKMYIQLFTN